MNIYIVNLLKPGDDRSSIRVQARNIRHALDFVEKEVIDYTEQVEIISILLFNKVQERRVA